jgi:hypothetical protein
MCLLAAAATAAAGATGVIASFQLKLRNALRAAVVQ